MEIKYKSFKDYDWRNSSEWQLYYENLFPKPPGNRIEFWKKKFYKLKVDSDFDINWEPPATTTQTGSTQGANTNHQQSFHYPSANPPFVTGSKMDIGIAGIECGIWLYFFLAIVAAKHQVLKVLCVGLIIRVFRRIGFPKFKMEYAQNLFLDEHFQLFLYTCLFFIDRLNLFVLVPLVITALLNIADFFKTYIKVKTFDYIFRKRVELAAIRANIEVAVGFFLVIGIFFGLNSFVLPLFFWQYMRFKYIVNKDIELSFSNMNWYVNRFKTSANCPRVLKYVIEKIQEFCAYIVRTEAAPGQAAGGQNCVIF